MEQILVTGAAGFLGRYVLKALAEAGARVRAFDVRVPQAVPEGAEWLQGDVRDKEAVRDACEGTTRVVHLAGLIPQKSPGDATMWAVNVDGTQHVLEGARAAGVQRVVYVSSAEVYGIPAVIPCPEDAPLAPQGVYGRSKVAAEKLCHAMQSVGVEVVILRPPTIVGPVLMSPLSCHCWMQWRKEAVSLCLAEGPTDFRWSMATMWPRPVCWQRHWMVSPVASTTLELSTCRHYARSPRPSSSASGRRRGWFPFQSHLVAC